MAQKRGAVWCFGDSALVNFSDTSNITTGISAVKSRGSCASIADTSGQLLFYANDRTNTAGNYTTLVYNNQHEIMPNGDSIVGEGWYNEMIILPLLGNDSLFYLFNLSTAIGPMGLYYSIVDMKADSGRGDVISKNIQLQTFAMSDCLNAVKHGNGRDWWLIFRTYDGSNATTNNKFYTYLISLNGITNFQIQNVGSMHNAGLGQISFNKEGNKMSFNSYRGTLELFDFDRCTGIISNPELLFMENASGPWPARRSAVFSPNSDYLYVSTAPDTTYLIQYDLNASNIVASADTLWTLSQPYYSGGFLKCGPNDKIYFSCCYQTGLLTYPYHDSIYNPINMNLGVINSPNNAGAACDFQPFSFYLGGKRTYWGLPNNPDYDLGPLLGSPCDTLVGLNESASTASATATATMFVYYTSGWQTAFINAQHVTGNRYNLKVFDMMGKAIFLESGALNPPYFTKNLNCSSFAKGVYTVVLITEKERLVNRFVKE
jgi:hypothetical protein